MLARTPLEQLLTVDNVAAWLRTMPAEGEYCYLDNFECAIAQFCRVHGYNRVIVGWAELREVGGPIIKFASKIEFAVGTSPHAYGAALARLEAVL